MRKNLTEIAMYKLPVNYEELTRQERREVREQYIKEQDGKCFWCNQPLDGDPVQEVQDASINLSLFPPGFLKFPVHLQHDHFTGMTEGAVHARCNAFMWQYHGR